MAACSMPSPLHLDPSTCSSSSAAKSLPPDPEDSSSLSATSSSSVRLTAITAPLFGNSIGTNLPWYGTRRCGTLAAQSTGTSIGTLLDKAVFNNVCLAKSSLNSPTVRTSESHNTLRLITSLLRKRSLSLALARSLVNSLTQSVNSWLIPSTLTTSSPNPLSSLSTFSLTKATSSITATLQAPE